MNISPIPKQFSSLQGIFSPTNDWRSRIGLRLEEGTVWLSQNLIANLYPITKQIAGHHIRNIFDDGELASEGTVRQYLTVHTERYRTGKNTVIFAVIKKKHQFTSTGTSGYLPTKEMPTPAVGLYP